MAGLNLFGRPRWNLYSFDLFRGPDKGRFLFACQPPDDRQLSSPWSDPPEDPITLIDSNHSDRLSCCWRQVGYNWWRSTLRRQYIWILVATRCAAHHWDLLILLLCQMTGLNAYLILNRAEGWRQSSQRTSQLAGFNAGSSFIRNCGLRKPTCRY